MKKQLWKLLFPLKEDEFCKFGPKSLVCSQNWRVKAYNFPAYKENMSNCRNTTYTIVVTWEFETWKFNDSLMYFAYDNTVIFQNNAGLKHTLQLYK